MSWPLDIRAARWMIVRKIDDQPIEVVLEDDFKAAYALYDRMQEQWTETFLVQIRYGPGNRHGIANPPDTPSFADDDVVALRTKITQLQKDLEPFQALKKLLTPVDWSNGDPHCGCKRFIVGKDTLTLHQEVALRALDEEEIHDNTDRKRKYGKSLHSLRDRGLAEWIPTGPKLYDPMFIRITPKGRQALAAL